MSHFRVYVDGRRRRTTRITRLGTLRLAAGRHVVRVVAVERGVESSSARASVKLG